MAARPVRPRAPKHPRLHIWGQLEARLQHADLLLLGGLNEGVWPRFADPGPWLSGSMREASRASPRSSAGSGSPRTISSPAAAAGAVVLSRAEKDAEGSPTVPSRWLVRLQDPARPAAARPRPAARTGGPGRGSTTSPVGRARTRDRRPSRPRRRPAARALGQRHRALDGRPLRALRQAHPGAQAARGARGRSGRARARHHHPPRARALRQGLPGRPAGRRRAPPARPRPDAVRGLQPPAAGDGALVAALRADRPLGDRAGAGAPRAAASRSGPRSRAGSSWTACDFVLKARADRLERLPDGRITVIDYKTGRAAEARRRARGPRSPAAARGRDGRGRRVPATSAPPAVAELLFWRLKGDETGGEEQAPAAMRAGRARGRGARRAAPSGRPLRPARDRLSRPAQAPGRLAGRLRPPGAARRMDQLSARAAARRPAPTPEQRRAADPAGSIWVTASAGTGKTQVLADRVMRLLLAGTDPRQILCLTFTKAAAAEMVKRVEEDLSRFAILPEPELEAELRAARRPAADRGRARARADVAGAGSRPARRPADHDHPRLLPVAAQALSARGGRRAAFRRARPAQRRRPSARGPGRGAGEPQRRDPRGRSPAWPCCSARRRSPRALRRCARTGCGSARCSRTPAPSSR